MVRRWLRPVAQQRARGHRHVRTDHQRLDHVRAGRDAGGGRDGHARAQLRAQDGDPAHRQPQLPGLAQVHLRHHVERVEVEVRLVEAVEQHQAVAPAPTTCAANAANAE